MAEIWDIYDKNRQLTGLTVERGKPMKQDQYHLVVDVWIINSKGEWLISKRTPNKHFPLMWECTGGSAISGEDSITAALREVKEELGIDLDRNKGKLFTTGIRQLREFPDFKDIWVFEHDCNIDNVVLQEGETCDAMWASSDKIKELIAAGDFVPQTAIPYINPLFDKYKKQEEQL